MRMAPLSMVESRRALLSMLAGMLLCASATAGAWAADPAPGDARMPARSGPPSEASDAPVEASQPDDINPASDSDGAGRLSRPRSAGMQRASVCHRPTEAVLQMVLHRLKPPKGAVFNIVLGLAYTREGKVTDVLIFSGSGHRELDRAAEQWGRHVRMCPGPPGWGTIPLEFRA